MSADTIHLSPTDRLFVLTGAGISAESGIPTFRDANGLWHNYRLEEVASLDAWARDPELVWNFYSMRRRGAAPCQPNPAHIALAELEGKLGDRFFLCTQNVDSLHGRAGSKRMVHMHGELFKSRCEACELEPFEDECTYESLGAIARCPKCSERIRPHICWFGEMPYDMERIYRELERCTVLAVIGTSGNVYPAAGFVQEVRARYMRGAELARTYYVGPEEPQNALAFDKVFLGKAGEVVPTLFSIER